MHTKIVEVLSPQGNWGKFLLGRFAGEWVKYSEVGEGVPLLAQLGWTPHHLLVLDLATGEGAIFRLGGLAVADLNKHRIWVCPLFEPFLQWLYEQDVGDLDELPSLVRLDGPPLAMAGYRRPGPEPEHAA